MGEHVRRIGHIRISESDQTVPTELQELLQALGGGNKLIVYRLDRLDRDEQQVTGLLRQIKALGVMLVVVNDAEKAGGSHAE